MTTFTRNKDLVKEKSFSAGYINQSGLYVGHFTKCYEKEAESGSKAIHFDFMSPQGQQSFDIWHYSGKKDSDIEMGIERINDLMTVLNIDTLKPKNNTPVEMWDRMQSAFVTNRVTAYPQLIDTPIGIVFQREEYAKQSLIDGKWVNNGEIGERTEFVMFCDFDTQATAAEIENDTAPSYVEKFLEKQQDVKRLKLSQQKAETANVKQQAEKIVDNFYDEPF